ncbi:hypothetical protein [Brachyspira intermedia]|uniref:hypothetical protein n=1 Tax=Brachyspira intermedia TaxID=84377 RepID=UPI003007C8F8
MMKKILPIFIIISILVLSCSSPSDPNNDNSSGNSGTGYIANGIPTTYDGTWQFYNVDSSGNTPVNVNISGGSITGLVISNKSGSKQNFDKSKIYSKEKEFDNIYYGGYNGYIVSDGNWVGEIQLPNGSSTGIGYVSIKNSSTGDIIEGILDNNSGIKRGEDLTSVDDIKGTWNSDTKQLVIDAQFITYSDNGQQVFKIPFMFFSSFGGYGGTGYEILGLLYNGVNINTTKASVPENIVFKYIENNNHLTIEIGSDGVPTKVEYINKPENIVSAIEFAKSTE